MAFLCGVCELATTMADDANPGLRKSRNVIYITWDGFRWQELFGGAQEILIAKDAGVADLDGVKTRYWRESEVERREVLLPFMWKTIAKHGQIFGDPSKNAAAKLENTHKFSYPGYSEMFCGFADDKGIDSNKKFPNPHVNVLEFLNRLRKASRRDCDVGCVSVDPQPGAERLVRQRRHHADSWQLADRPRETAERDDR